MPRNTSDDSAIQSGTVYPLEAFKRLTGFGNHAMRTARRNGLKVRYVGGRGFVDADDFHAYLRALDAQSGAQESATSIRRL